MSMRREVNSDLQLQVIDEDKAPRAVWAFRAPQPSEYDAGDIWFDRAGLQGHVKDPLDGAEYTFPITPR